MKFYREVRIVSKCLLAADILKTILEFAPQSDAWEIHETLNKDSGLGENCMIISRQSPKAAIAFYSERKNKRAVYVSNIVPRDKRQLSLKEYNNAAWHFVKGFRVFVRSEKLDLSVRITEEERGLEAVIPGGECRKRFQQYLNCYPLSYHANDIENLDFFICAVSRYHTHANAYTIAQYLISDLKWSKKDANFVRDRMLTGLAILRANRRFHWN